MLSYRISLFGFKNLKPVARISPIRSFHRGPIWSKQAKFNYSKQQPVLQSSVANVSKKLFKYSMLAMLGITGYFTYITYLELHPRKQLPQSTTFKDGSPRKRLVILGTGWGAVSLLKKLDTTEYNVVVVSPRNYFLFTPLLTSTPVGTIDLKSIMEPIRHILKRKKGEVVYLEANATDIDPTKKNIKIMDNNNNETRTLPYDYLVMCVGAESTTFHIPGVRENAIFIKEAYDSTRMKEKILNNIERAAFLEMDDPKRKQLLTFVVVGGGPTGVEMAAELQDYVNESLSTWMPEISKDIQVKLVEGLPNILNMFDKNLIEYTQAFIKKSKIDLKLNTFVKGVDPNIITVEVNKEKQEIPYGVLIWATGIQPRDITRKLAQILPEIQTDRRGLLINEKLQLLGAESSIYAIGDCTFHGGLAPTAQVAHQEGLYLANIFKQLHKLDQLDWKSQLPSTTEKQLTDIKKKQDHIINNKMPNFEYNYKGTLAYIGSERAIAELKIAGKDYQLRGSPFAFLFWKIVYLSMCVSIRNTLMVSMDWFKFYFFGRNSI
ncbi:similar to Saccharomyces cerevisiae YDL085W NDE2 Mitochondrial external NADH dehydrogenase, catalyzes the oxidation of cytosolic NADH [Maudiozyma saulgeensis]|uniref:NADH:ubiquinone reductase (non-electrogenic) n=1 Tax=Maudiozyma saulgeensis TaxID=1789683 RepID=A0A1X7QZN8_9SACH|nr:similar to Saccharomyces cerevisiae YDL085W NDE2 Mitochondrial external NADH dehydrogenase, catalyzes the oxidation of cytosolic NADH [Kazachstania saulgeensis]